MYLTWANWGKNRDCGRSCMSAPGAVHSRALSPMHEQHGGGKELGKLPALRYQAHLPACVFCHKAVCHSEKCCVPSQPDALHWSHGSDGLVAGPGGLNDFMIWSQGSGGNFLSSPLENGKYWKNGMKKTLRSSVERNDNFLILVEMEDGRSASGTRQHFTRGLRNSGEVQEDLSSLSCVGARRQLVGTWEQRQAEPCSPLAAQGQRWLGLGSAGSGRRGSAVCQVSIISWNTSDVLWKLIVCNWQGPAASAVTGAYCRCQHNLWGWSSEHSPREGLSVRQLQWNPAWLGPIGKFCISSWKSNNLVLRNTFLLCASTQSK